jgi:hypothetical protein
MILVVMVAEAWGLLLGGIFMQPKKAQTATTGAPWRGETPVEEPCWTPRVQGTGLPARVAACRAKSYHGKCIMVAAAAVGSS